MRPAMARLGVEPAWGGAMAEVHTLIEDLGVETARSLATTAAERLEVDAAAAILGDEGFGVGITHAGFAMTALPYSRVSEPIWRREGGVVRLLVESGTDEDEAGTLHPVGIPYGATARMILLYLQTKAVQTRSREVELGASMAAWLGAMGLPTGGKNYRLVREQARRISRCRLTFLRRRGGMDAVTNAAFVRESILPAATSDLSDGRQMPLWQERVQLDEGFFRSLVDHPLPLREAAIRELAARPMALDAYIWLAYRLHALDRPVGVSWAAAHGQFGAGYGRVAHFRGPFTNALKLACAVYPEARLDLCEASGLTLLPSPPPVVERHRRLGRQ
jgi:Plasmid encoded RepA protein